MKKLNLMRKTSKNIKYRAIYTVISLYKTDALNAIIIVSETKKFAGGFCKLKK